MLKFNYIFGLDLGQQNDYTVMSLLEPYEEKGTIYYKVPFLYKFDLHTPYTTIAQKVDDITKTPIFQNRYVLAVDYTGVGRPIYDLLIQRQIVTVAINITGGLKASCSGNSEFNVPKKELISAVQIVLQNSRLKIAAGLNHIEDIKKEFLNFKAKISMSGKGSFEAAHGYHDDIVMSIGMAVWYAEHIHKANKKLRIITGR